MKFTLNNNNLSPDIMKYIFPKTSNPYDLRNKNPFASRNIRTVFCGSETLSHRGPETWAIVPSEIKASKSLNEFKSRIRLWKPVGCKCRICKVFVYNLGFL